MELITNTNSLNHSTLKDPKDFECPACRENAGLVNQEPINFQRVDRYERFYRFLVGYQCVKCGFLINAKYYGLKYHEKVPRRP